MSNGHEDETRLEDAVSWTPSAILQKMVTRQHKPGCILWRMEDGLSSVLIRNPLRKFEKKKKYKEPEYNSSTLGICIQKLCDVNEKKLNMLLEFKLIIVNNVKDETFMLMYII